MFKSPVVSKPTNGLLMSKEDIEEYKKIGNEKNLGTSRSSQKLDICTSIHNQPVNQINNRPKMTNSRNMNLKLARRDKVNLADSCNSRYSTSSVGSANRIDKIFGSAIKESSIASKIIESSLNKFKERGKISNVKFDSYQNLVHNLSNEKPKQNKVLELSPKYTLVDKNQVNNDLTQKNKDFK